MPTPAESYIVNVIVERRPLDNPWQDHAWVAVAAEAAGEGDVDQGWIDLPDDGLPAGVTRHKAHGFTIELFRKETEGYKINLAQPEPRVFVVLRPNEDDDDGPEMQVFHVTVCPYEAEHYIESGDEQVEGVPMPDEIRTRLQAFVDTHHVEVPFKKRKRKDHDPRKDGEARPMPRALQGRR